MPEDALSGYNYKLANAEISSPELNPDSKKLPEIPPTRAVKDYGQAGQIVRRAENDNRERNLKNARIMAKYNAERPHDPNTLKNDGLAWKSNFSTQPLAALIDRVSPRFTAAINSVKYLTSSSLPEDWPGASEKTETFRSGFTKMVRARQDWQDFIGEVSQENALFGYTGVGWTDEYTYFPTHFRGDRYFVPIGSKQHAKGLQWCVEKELLFPHELFEQLKDKQSSEDAGWEWSEAIEAINNAMPIGLRSNYSNAARIFEDLIRESNVATSHFEGAKVIQVYNLFVQEVTGKVSHFKLVGPSMKGIFTRLDRYDCMEEATVTFTFQQANGTVHGSKGIGRQVYNMAAVLDRARNEVVDRLQLSGKILLQGDPKELKRFKMSVVGNAILIGKQFDVVEKKIDAAVDEFFQLDNYMTAMLDRIAGNTSPNQELKGERVTAAQVNVVTSREEEGKDNVLARFMSQMSNLFTQMQIRACSDKCDEPDAEKFREDMLKKMTEEELDMLAHCPSAEVVKDLSEMERQQVILIAQENQGNPLINQKELKRRQLTAQLGAEFANAVLLPDNDPNEEAEQTRQQQLENMLLMQGQKVEVSGRDNHKIHLAELEPMFQVAALAATQNPQAAIPILKNLVSHGQRHAQIGIATATDKESYAGDMAKIKAAMDAIHQLETHEAAIAQAQAAGLSPDQALTSANAATQSLAASQAGQPTPEDAQSPAPADDLNSPAAPNPTA